MKSFDYKKSLGQNFLMDKNIIHKISDSINPNEEEEWLYNAALSIGNTVIYSPVMGRDKYTFQEIELIAALASLCAVLIELIT